MKTLFPEPKTTTQAIRQANIMERAMTLTESGYRLVRRSRPTLYGVYKPENNTIHSSYVVDQTPGRELCTCKGFRNDGDCKHRIAVALMEEEEARFERQAEEDTEARYYLHILHC